MDDKPWFIRLGANLRPYSAPGWIATAVYVLGVLGLGFILRRNEADRTRWIVYAIVMATWTAAYLILAYRNSERGELVLDRDRAARK